MDKKAVLFSVLLVCVLLISTVFGSGFSVSGDDISGERSEKNIFSGSSEDELSSETSGEEITASSYPFSSDYPSVSQLYDWYDNLTANYPNICEKIKYGESWEGRDLWAIKVSDNVSQDEDEPEILIDGGMHAREWSGPQVASYYLYRILNEFDTNDTIHWLVENREIFVVPMINPDGYIYDGNGDTSQQNSWRKNRNESVGTSTDVGVDLNRNWDIDWENGDYEPSNSTYHGESPFSEYETQNYSEWILSRDIQSYQNLHSYAGTLLIPWSYTSSASPHDSWYRDMAADMTDHTSIMGDENNHYSYGQASETIGYSAPGGANDWVYNATGAHGLCFEIATGDYTGFYPSTSEIMTINKDLDDSLIYQTRIADADLGNGADEEHPPAPYLLYGNVVNSSGSPVTDTKVLLKNSATGEKLSVMTDENGYYEFDFANFIESSYSDSDDFVLNVGGTQKTFGIGSEWGQRINLTYTAPPTQSFDFKTGAENDGWYFISTRVRPEDTDIKNLLSGIDGKYDKVFSKAPDYTDNTYETSVFNDDVENGSDGWTTFGNNSLWHISTNRYSSSSHSWAYNDGTDYDTGAANDGTLKSQWLDISNISSPKLSYKDWIETEGASGYDLYSLHIQSDTDGWTQVFENYQSSASWDEHSFGIENYVSQDSSKIQMKFVFDTVDDYNNGFEGWYIDDINVTGKKTELVENDKGWNTYIPNRSARFNDLGNIDEKTGFWIHLTEKATLNITGFEPTDTTLDLYPGWNMVGYPSNNMSNNGLPTAVDKVGYFNSNTTYNLAYTENVQSFAFEPGKGYWIHNPTDKTLEWTVEY